MSTPPSSPSSLIRVASSESSIVVVSSTPIAPTTLWTKSAICLVKVSFTLRPRQLSALAVRGGGAAGAGTFHATFRRRPGCRERWRSNHPVGEVLLSDRPEVSDEPIQDQAAWYPEEH